MVGDGGPAGRRGGATGGASAGGAGGVSAAVLYKGPEPTIQGTPKLTPGEKGAPGSGGVPGTNDGPDGAAGEMIAAP